MSLKVEDVGSCDARISVASPTSRPITTLREPTPTHVARQAGKARVTSGKLDSGRIRKQPAAANASNRTRKTPRSGQRKWPERTVTVAAATTSTTTAQEAQEAQAAQAAQAALAPTGEEGHKTGETMQDSRARAHWQHPLRQGWSTSRWSGGAETAGKDDPIWQSGTGEVRANAAVAVAVATATTTASMLPMHDTVAGAVAGAFVARQDNNDGVDGAMNFHVVDFGFDQRNSLKSTAGRLVDREEALGPHGTSNPTASTSRARAAATHLPPSRLPTHLPTHLPTQPSTQLPSPEHVPAHIETEANTNFDHDSSPVAAPNEWHQISRRDCANAFLPLGVSSTIPFYRLDGGQHDGLPACVPEQPTPSCTQDSSSLPQPWTLPAHVPEISLGSSKNYFPETQSRQSMPIHQPLGDDNHTPGQQPPQLQHRDSTFNSHGETTDLHPSVHGPTAMASVSHYSSPQHHSFDPQLASLRLQSGFPLFTNPSNHDDPPDSTDSRHGPHLPAVSNDSADDASGARSALENPPSGAFSAGYLQEPVAPSLFSETSHQQVGRQYIESQSYSNIYSWNTTSPSLNLGSLWDGPVYDVGATTNDSAFSYTSNMPQIASDNGHLEVHGHMQTLDDQATASYRDDIQSLPPASSTIGPVSSDYQVSPASGGLSEHAGHDLGLNSSVATVAAKITGRVGTETYPAAPSDFPHRPENSQHVSKRARPVVEEASRVPGSSEKDQDASSVLLSVAKQAKGRKSFAHDERQETARTRLLKACVRCRTQRIRCKPNSDDPHGPCATCKEVDVNSRKLTRPLHCVRFKITDFVLNRPSGSLNLTARWDGKRVTETREWDGTRVVVIDMMQDVCPDNRPITLKLRKFRPRHDDRINREYFDEETQTVKEEPLEPYSLANVEESINEFSKYIKDNARDAIMSYAKKSKIAFFRDHYHHALQHYDSPNLKKEDKALLANTFYLWFATQLTLGSSWLCGKKGRDTLGHRATPRMVVAQFDRISPLHILRGLRMNVLRDLENAIRSKTKERFFTVYIVMFMLLHLVSRTCLDRSIYAKRKVRVSFVSPNHPYKLADSNCMKHPSYRYDLPDFIESLQTGARALLCYWDYYKGRDSVLNGAYLDQCNLSPNQKALLQHGTVEVQQLQRSGHIRSDGYENDYFWTGQMLQHGWSPQPIWTKPTWTAA